MILERMRWEWLPWLKGLRVRVWWRIRYGKHIAPGTWSRGSDYGRRLWREMKASGRL